MPVLPGGASPFVPHREGNPPSTYRVQQQICPQAPIVNHKQMNGCTVSTRFCKAQFTRASHPLLIIPISLRQLQLFIKKNQVFIFCLLLSEKCVQKRSKVAACIFNQKILIVQKCSA